MTYIAQLGGPHPMPPLPVDANGSALRPDWSAMAAADPHVAVAVGIIRDMGIE